MAKTLRVDIVGDSSRLVAATKKGEFSLASIGKVAGIAGLAIAGGLAVGLKKAAEGALEDEVANERLSNSFKNAHVSAEKFTNRIEGAEEAGRKLGFQDEQVTESLGSLVTATKSGTKAIQLNATAMDIARFKHVGLGEASKMLTSTMAGNVRSAKALGIVLLPVTKNVDDLRDRYEKLGKEIPNAELRSAKFADKQATAAQAIEKVNAAVKGQAETFAGTAQGKLEIYNARMDQLKDSIGKGVLPAMVAVTEKLSVLAAFFAEHEVLTKRLIIALGGLAAAFIATSVAAFILANALTLGIASAVLVVGAGVALLITHFDQVVSWLKTNWPLIVGIMAGPLALAVALVVTQWAAIKAAISSGMNAILGVVRNTWNTVKNVFFNALDTLASVALRMVLVILEPFTHLPFGMGKWAQQAKEAVENKLEAINLARAERRINQQLASMSASARAQAAGMGAGIGGALVSGIAAGIVSGSPAVRAAAAGAVASAVAAAQAAARSKSPSLEMKEKVGVPLGLGVIAGLKSVPLERQITSHLKTVLAGASAAVVNSSNTLLTAPLRAAKQNADDWAASDGVENMTGVGAMLGKSVVAGLQSGLGGPNPLGFGFKGALPRGALVDTTAPGGIHGTVQPGSPNVSITVEGSVVTERQLISSVRDALVQAGLRNGGGILKGQA